MISQVLTKFQGFQAKTSSTTKDACERLNRCNVERAPICFGLYETKLSQALNVIQEMVFLSSHTYRRTQIIPQVRVYMAAASRSDLAAEFSICFQFQVHMADCINGSRSGRDLKKTACF